jgi:hypothetical protein
MGSAFGNAGNLLLGAGNGPPTFAVPSPRVDRLLGIIYENGEYLVDNTRESAPLTIF